MIICRLLWKLDRKIQARYFWNYVLKLEKTEEKLRKKIKKKLVNEALVRE